MIIILFLVGNILQTENSEAKLCQETRFETTETDVDQKNCLCVFGLQREQHESIDFFWLRVTFSIGNPIKLKTVKP